MTLRLTLALVIAAAVGSCARTPAPAMRASIGPSSTSIERAPATTAPTTTAPAVVIPASSPVAAGTTSASWYGSESGSHTANGERYDAEGLTFAHRTMPFGTAVRFCRGGACVVATCTDRGPLGNTVRAHPACALSLDGAR